MNNGPYRGEAKHSFALEMFLRTGILQMNLNITIVIRNLLFDSTLFANVFEKFL